MYVWALIRPKKRHVAALAIFLPLLLIILYFVTKRTEAYEEAERFVSEDVRIVDALGRVSRVEFKFWKGFQFTGSEADFSFEVESEKGVCTVEVHLRKVSGQWRTETADIRTQNGMERRIVVGIRQSRWDKEKPDFA